MLTPGFIVKNETIWPLQISLRQVGPLYYDVVQPGETFVRETGAVWFTIQADLFMDESQRITVGDAIAPVAMIAGSVLLAAATGGAAATAAGPAMAAAGGATATAAATTLSSVAAATSVTAQALVASGLAANTALWVAGAAIGAGGAALSSAGTAALRDVFSGRNASTNLAGCYAGPPWPFRTDVTPWRVVGGPKFRPVDGHPDHAEPVGEPLRIVR